MQFWLTSSAGDVPGRRASRCCWGRGRGRGLWGDSGVGQRGEGQRLGGGGDVPARKAHTQSVYGGMSPLLTRVIGPAVHTKATKEVHQGLPNLNSSFSSKSTYIFLWFLWFNSLRKTQLETCPRVRLVLDVNVVHHNSIMSSMNNIEHVSTHVWSMLWPDVDYNYDVYYHDHHLTWTNNIEWSLFPLHRYGMLSM